MNEQLATQWSLLVNDSSSSFKLLSKLTRASNLLHEIINTRNADAHEKRQRSRRGIIALQRLQQRYPSCSWIARYVAMAKPKLPMAEKAIYDMQFHGSMARWIRVGDKTTKVLFQFKQPRQARTMMRSLNRENGSTNEDGEEMRNISTT